MSMETLREITVEECPWLDENIPDGTPVYIYHGPTYGCIGPNGVAVTLVENQTPFFEVPRNSVG